MDDALEDTVTVLAPAPIFAVYQHSIAEPNAVIKPLALAVEVFLLSDMVKEGVPE